MQNTVDYFLLFWREIYIEKERKRYREIKRVRNVQRYIEKDIQRKIYREMYREIYREIDREIYREILREIYREIYVCMLQSYDLY